MALCVFIGNFTMQPRYDIYSSLTEVPDYWAIPGSSAGFQQATQVYRDVGYIVQLQDVYFTVQGIK